MSSYVKEKVIRMRVNPKDYDIMGIKKDIWDLEDIHPDLFSKDGAFEIAPTEGEFIDYVIESEYTEYNGGDDYGFARYLTKDELDKYLPMFQKINPICCANDLRYVDFCWYNCSEAPDYFEVIETYKEVSSDEFVETDKYNNMISAFQCDFTLAREGEQDLSEIDLTSEKVSADIDLLEEFEFKLRNGQAKILVKGGK